ncbi:MAG TPA: hypothetical protein VKN73_08750 [Desulfosalsimonadaceae bacterium]|nr:hypothetical protein [Desulfosalsimonadaceae bacterium]
MTQPVIRPDMTLLDIISQYRETETVFKSYDPLAGECICCNSLFDTLEQMVEKYRFDMAKIQKELEEAISSA